MDILEPEVKELPIPNLMHLHLVSYVCESKFSLYLNVCGSVIQLWIVRLMVDLGTFALFRIKIGTVIIGVKWNNEFNAPYAHPVCIALHFYQHWMHIILIK